jgi:4-alpha-glucanotransferase
VIDGPEGDDARLRPNQLFAVSLEPDLIDDARAEAIVAACGSHLLTSLGLRTLAPFEPDYESEYCGDRWSRDGAYHQGTVWPWLLGAYVRAHLRVHGDRAAARAMLHPLVHHLGDHGMGSISEVADGAAPHAPRAAPFQAWSVAEALRLAVDLGMAAPS